MKADKLLNSTIFFHRIVLEVCLTISFVIVASCVNSSKRNGLSNKGQLEASILSSDRKMMKKTIDIPIFINLSHNENMKQLVDAEYEITCETDNDIYIDINSRYYKQYTSRTRFKVDQLVFFDNSENVEYLTMCLDVVNNTSERLSIKELNIIVDESKPDSIPIIYICTEAAQSNSIRFVNESWFNWKGFTFSYSILKNGESFNGHYTQSRHIPYFDSDVIINLLPDMILMGYDFDGLMESIKTRDLYANDYNDDSDYRTCVMLNITEEDDDFCDFQGRFKPFGLKKGNFGEYVGVATLYGSIKFDNIDFKVEFIAEISLSTPDGFGALSYANDEFNVKLKSLGNDYTLKYPYVTVIEPYGTEMIKLTMIADKSSLHKFHVDIKNDNGLKVKSKEVHFHHYFPKN